MKKEIDCRYCGYKNGAFEQHQCDRIILHVIPENDLEDHFESLSCKCSPKFVDDIIVHNSFDGREFLENGIDKRN